MAAQQQQQAENKNVRQKEKKRTECINRAFSELRRCIPNVPSDTKLSKIKTLRLASSYIAYLSELLQGSSVSSSGGADGRSGAKEFHAEMQMLRGKEKYARNNQLLEADPQVSYNSVRGDCPPARKPDEPLEKKKGRTGWPEAVWAEALEASERPGKAKMAQGHMILDESNYFIPHQAAFRMDFDDQTQLSSSPRQYMSDECGVMYTNAERVLLQQCDIISPENEALMPNLYQPAMGLQTAPTPPSAPGCVCFTDKPPPLPSIYTLSCSDKFQGQKSAVTPTFHPETSIDEPQLVELQTVVTSQHRDYRQHLLSSVGSGLLPRDEDGCLG